MILAFPFAVLAISIHAPRGGSDLIVFSPVFRSTVFQSTLPVGGATFCCGFGWFLFTDFNPRSPWGERPVSPQALRLSVLFQSTLPVGGATSWGIHIDTRSTFQSTLPVGGATAKMHKFPAASLAKVSNFVGQAPGKAVPNRFKSRYSPHRFTKKPCEPPGNSCSPELRTTGSGYPPADRCSCSRNAQPFFHIDSPGSRSGGCPFPDP